MTRLAIDLQSGDGLERFDGVSPPPSFQLACGTTEVSFACSVLCRG